jgi:hypothetical protein
VPEQLDQTLPRPAVPDTGRIFGSMARADIRWVIGGLIAAALLLVGFLGPWGPDMVDLEIYRMGGSALLSGSDVYAVRDPATGLAFTYPVFAAVLFIPFAAVPMSLAKLVILALSLAALWTIVHLTVEAVRQSIGAVRGSAFAWSIPLSVIAVIAHPVLQTMLFGQVNLILAAFVLIDVLRRDRSPFRGALVGIAAGIKLVPGIFIVYFLVTGQRRAAVTALLTTLGTVVAGFLASPSASWSYWTNHALDPDRMGGIAYVTNQSILGMSARLLREPHPPPALTFTLSAIVVAAVLLIARQLVRVGRSNHGGVGRRDCISARFADRVEPSLGLVYTVPRHPGHLGVAEWFVVALVRGRSGHRDSHDWSDAVHAKDGAAGTPPHASTRVHCQHLRSVGGHLPVLGRLPRAAREAKVSAT